MPRDFSVLRDLGDYRFLSVPQLVALHFPSEHSAQARLKRLVDAGLAIRVFMPVRPYDRTACSIFALSAKGSRLVAEHFGGKRPRFLSERERRSGLFLDHTLRRNDLRICLELLSRGTGPQLVTWKQRPDEVGDYAKIRINSRRHERVPIVPDGFFALVHKGRCEAFVVEIDMGTVRRERMFLRYRAYWRWWKDGRHYLRFGGAPLRVLTLTTTDKRLETLRNEAASAPECGRKGSKLFWFAKLETADICDPERLLAAAWKLATVTNDDQHYLLN